MAEKPEFVDLISEATRQNRRRAMPVEVDPLPGIDRVRPQVHPEGLVRAAFRFRYGLLEFLVGHRGRREDAKAARLRARVVAAFVELSETCVEIAADLFAVKIRSKVQ